MKPFWHKFWKGTTLVETEKLQEKEITFELIFVTSVRFVLWPTFMAEEGLDDPLNRGGGWKLPKPPLNPSLEASAARAESDMPLPPPFAISTSWKAFDIYHIILDNMNQGVGHKGSFLVSKNGDLKARLRIFRRTLCQLKKPFKVSTFYFCTRIMENHSIQLAVILFTANMLFRLRADCDVNQRLQKLGCNLGTNHSR